MKRSLLAVVTVGLLAVAGGRAGADFIVGATASSGGASSFGTLDLTTGQFSQSATLSIAVTGLTSAPNGTLYAGASNGNLYTVSGGVATQFGTVSAPVPSGGSQFGFYGLAYAGASGFYAENINALTSSSNSTVLDQVSPAGTNLSTVGTLASGFSNFGTGGLAFGPNGSLYFVASDASGNTDLFVVNTTSGVATEVGTGLGTLNNDVLTLVTIGGQLFGIDTQEPSGSGPINIYTINTTTGVATATGVTVSGLAAGFTLDTAAAIPEPSSLALCGIAAAVALAARSLRRRLAA